jgi:SSS family solute:Na+ symporter
MTVSPLDVLLFAAFYALVLGVSLWKSRRETGSADFFLAGRGLTWPLIGVSIVAANISTEQLVGMAGQGAGSVGLAVSAWQLTGSAGIVVIAFTLLPRFLRAGIYTMPEFLEYRYNAAARAIMAFLTVLVYVGVLLAAVLYSGGLTLETIFGLPLTTGVWVIAAIATLYTAWGGLKAVAWADLFQGIALLAGGLLTFFLGLEACGGWEAFTSANADRLHMILPATDPDLPWTGVASGMWIVILYYCGLNQFIVQRNLAARSLRDGQLGVILAGALWLLVPFAIVMPGIMAHQLHGGELAGEADRAYPTLIRELVPPGVRGFMLAAIAGAVVSSLASMLNSASAIFTMDVYKRILRPGASETSLVWVGRAATVVAVVAGCLVAPHLADPRFGGVFQYIQQFQGYIWPGVVAAFVMAFVLPRAPAAAGVLALVTGPLIYAALQLTARSDSRPWGHGLHFLIQVFLAFAVTAALMALVTWWRPLTAPRTLPVREEIETTSSPAAKLAGAAVLIGVAAFFVVFR